MEQQTHILLKSRMKPREGQKRAIFSSLIWGGSRFSIYFVQDCGYNEIFRLLKFNAFFALIPVRMNPLSSCSVGLKEVKQ